MQIIRDLQQRVRNFFGISAVEANGFIILLPLLIISLLLFPFYHHLFAPEPIDHIKDKQQLMNLIAELEKNKKTITDENQPPERLLSSIDPNTANFNDLLLLNLDTIIAARIIKYRNSGGNFTHKEDLLRIYGLNKEKYQQIQSKIALPEEPDPVETDFQVRQTEVVAATEEENSDHFVKENKYKPEKLQPFNINTADSALLKKIHGIGPTLSTRIIKYRDLVGGFVDTTQYKEVYGLDNEVLEQLFQLAVIDGDFDPVKININASDKKTLAQHPYISWKVASAITAFREQHGNFTAIEKLREIKLIDAKTYDKIVPYLSL